jgi:Tfp pilus assembly protein PilN
MNLRVNLIDEHEIRDCSVITSRFVIFVLAGLVVAVILSVLGWAFITAQRNATALKEETWKWGRIEADFKKANILATRRQAIERVASDLDGWRNARISWRDELTALAAIMPETLQLTDLRMASEISVPPAAEPAAEPAKPPELSASLRLIGKTSSLTAEADVARLLDAFSEHPFAKTVSEAVIPQGAFRLDPASNAGLAGRLFEIVCTYRVKTLK